MTESCHFAPGYPINQILNVRGRWDMTKEITATKPLLKHTWMLNVSVNRRRFDWELSGEIMVRNRECLRLGKSAIFHSRYSKWKLVAICLKWEIKDVASVLLLVKQTFVIPLQNITITQEQRPCTEQTFNTSINKWFMRSMGKNWSYIYIFIQTLYTQQKQASKKKKNLCTGKKYTICGGNKLGLW